MMRAFGYEKPLVAGEYNAPWPNLCPEATARCGVEVDGVTRLEVPERPNLSVFEVRRHRRGPLLVVWDQRDPFDGEDEPPLAFDWAWPAARAIAVDALGQGQPAEVLDGRVRLQVSLTPVFVAAD